MSLVSDFLEDIPLPRMVRVAQRFDADRLPDAAQAVRDALRQPDIAGRVKPGMRVALAVGSRGMDQLPRIIATMVAELRNMGAHPFVVPAMGSHGGATAEGQQAVLAHLGVTEDSVGCPIVSSMETVSLGTLPNGLAVLMDANAMAADGIIPINRIKPHTSFSGKIESGVVKMLSIGLGKQKGADACHAQGFARMEENVVAMARVKLERAPVLFGLATIENAFDAVCSVAALPPETMFEREKELLCVAKSKMPRLLFNPLDVLVIDLMGKEFSGTGTDPNITGRAANTIKQVTQKVSRMAVLSLSEGTAGNATGVGLADITTKRLFDQINFEYTYINHLTSTEIGHGKIPLIMNSDRLAIQAAVKTCNIPDMTQVRLAHIRNTLHIGEIRISEALLPEARTNPHIEILGEPEEWDFTAEGDVRTLGAW